MKTHPILFSSDMIQAILEGRKSMTRRVIRMYSQDDHPLRQNPTWFFENKTCPYGIVGDVLWVRETFCLTQPVNPEDYYFGYKAGGPCSSEKASEKYDYSNPDIWKPGIHMPKEACRIFLKVMNVRVDRLQHISYEDCENEGILKRESGLYHDYENPKGEYHYVLPKQSFGSLWRIINGVESWELNPWVWVISFERCEKQEGF